MRSLMTALLALALTATACARDTDPPAATPHAVILQYHHVADDTPASTSVSEQRFADHIDYLLQHDYRVWPLPEVVDALQARRSVPEKVVVITFDDAYLNIYENAFPLLQRHKLPFTIFTNTDPVNRGFASHASWEQLREMAQHGATITNHSHSHAHMAVQRPGQSEREWRQWARQEILQAQQRIEKEIGQDYRLFAYPYGEYTPALIDLVRELDFIGFGQQSGPVGADSDFGALPRFPVSAGYGDPEAFATRLRTLPLPLASEQAPPNPLPHAQERPTAELVLQDERLAQSLNCFASGQGAIPVRLEGRRVTVQASKAIPVGRSRYNCTAPAGAGQFYWHSVPWIRLREDGSWVLD